MALMMQQQQQDAAALLVLLHQRRRRRRRRRRSTYWVRPWIARRLEFGHYHNLMAELEREHHGDFINYLRMDPAMFHELLQRLTPRLTKQDTKWRPALQPGLKLAITLRFLANGATYHSLSFSFRVLHNAISLFVTEVLKALVHEYGQEVVTVPENEAAWRELGDKFGTRWNFHHACGALDGKHIAIKAPAKSSSPPSPPERVEAEVTVAVGLVTVAGGLAVDSTVAVASSLGRLLLRLASPLLLLLLLLLRHCSHWLGLLITV